jgi:hypothetical protein
MMGNGHSEQMFISIESGDLKHIVNLSGINSIQVSSINGELRSATITLNDAKNTVTVIGGNSVGQLIDFLKPHIKLDILTKK